MTQRALDAQVAERDHSAPRLLRSSSSVGEESRLGRAHGNGHGVIGGNVQRCLRSGCARPRRQREGAPSGGLSVGSGAAGEFLRRPSQLATVPGSAHPKKGALRPPDDQIVTSSTDSAPRPSPLPKKSTFLAIGEAVGSGRMGRAVGCIRDRRGFPAASLRARRSSREPDPTKEGDAQMPYVPALQLLLRRNMGPATPPTSD